MRTVQGVRLIAITLMLLFSGIPLSEAKEPTPHWRSSWSFPARLGLQLQPMTEELREYFDVPRDRGVLVVRVEPEKPAQRAGVQVGDVVVGVGGEPVSAPRDLIGVVRSAPAGKTLVLAIVREGKRLEIEVVPEGEPFPQFDPEPWGDFREHMLRGLQRGRDELRHRLQELERRLDELERRLAPPLTPGEERT
jgi:membrane-associated protease RseP (regulator of RpoE activity)